MRDVALLLFYVFCLAKGCVYVFSAAVIFTEHWWVIVRGLFA